MSDTSERRRPPRPPLVTRLIHGWRRLAHGMTLGVRAVVINEAREVLLVRHSYVSGWHLPGGGVDAGEAAEHALARELLEEAAVTLIGRPNLLGLLLNGHLARRDHVALYVVETFTAGTPRVPNREIIEVGFFPIDALPEETTAATRRRVAEVRSGSPPATFW
ncbi:NUDIX domain-containing protein [Ancylobacter pratisalsi]|uniref:NUDIX domain-containing protein n=1 Tax=Ancylobacter pratisalsi TaxID=1745854 RepID=UPI003CCCABA6